LATETVIGWVLHAICESAAGVAPCGATNEADVGTLVGAVGFEVPHAAVAIASTLQTAMSFTDTFILASEIGQHDTSVDGVLDEFFFAPIAPSCHFAQGHVRSRTDELEGHGHVIVICPWP
jgi:hypothetical protein